MDKKIENAELILIALTNALEEVHCKINLASIDALLPLCENTVQHQG